MKDLAKGNGTIFLKGKGYCWQRTVDGKKKTMALRDKGGQCVTSIITARAIVADMLRQEQETTAEAMSLRTTAEVVQKLATIKGLLHKNNTDLADLEKAWRDSPRRKVGNEPAKTTAIRHFVAWVGATYPQLTKAADITSNHAMEYMADYYASGVTARSWNVRLNMLDIVFRTVGNNSPFVDIAKKREQSVSREAFTTEQLAAIWRVLNNDKFHLLHKEEMKGVYITALYTGLRCGDVCCLSWDAVDMSRGTISLTPSKTSHLSGRKIVIPIAPPLRDVLNTMRMRQKDSGTPYVFSAVAKRYGYNRSGISADTIRLLEAAKIPTKDYTGANRQRAVVLYSFHSFRHTTASILANQGVNPLVIRDLLGHTSVEMSSHYTHIDLSTKATALDVLTKCYNPSNKAPSLQPVNS